MSLAIEERLRKKAKTALVENRGIRAPKTEDLFRRVCFFGPKDFLIENYPHKEPVAAFNPGATLVGERVFIFPRLIFDYYSYVSSIGVVELAIEELLSGEAKRPLRTQIVLWPQYGWEAVKGCEDPRVLAIENGFLILYTAVGEFSEDSKESHKAVLGFAELGKDFSVRRKGFFSVRGPEGTFIPGNKDSAFIHLQEKNAAMLTRPSFWELPDARLEPLFSLLELEPPRRPLPDMCWRAEADLEELVIFEDTMEPVFVPEPWEHKVGWSTNTVRLAENEYLVGWHGVLREDRSYREGLAIVDGSGRLLAVSDYLLAPRGLWEEYGDRPLVIFGNGLLLHGEVLIWIGGVSDYCIGVFTAELGDVLPLLRRI
jgi:predicted GH43/DUF377 family glycosyl hydrolase